MDSIKKPDDWLAAYEAAKQKALQNLDSGKLQSVTGISGFCGTIKNVDHLSSNYNVTKLINAMKDGKIKKKKTGQSGGGNIIEGGLSKGQRDKERKKRRNAKMREENGEEIQANAKKKDDTSDNEAKPKSTGLTKNQRQRERRKRRKKVLAAGNAEAEVTVDTDKSTSKKVTKKSKSNMLMQKSANQAILDEQKNMIMELQMGKSCDFQFPEKSGDCNADKNKPSKYTFKKFEFKPKPKESKALNKASSSNVLNGLIMIASSYDSKEVNNDQKVKIEKETSAGKLKSKEQESMSKLNSTAKCRTNHDSKETINDKKVQVRKEVSTQKSKSEEQNGMNQLNSTARWLANLESKEISNDQKVIEQEASAKKPNSKKQESMNQLNSTARWLTNLESKQDYDKNPDVSKNKKKSEPKDLSTTHTTNEKKRKIEEGEVSSKKIKNDVIHMNSLGLGAWLKELESDPDAKNSVDSDIDSKSSGPDKKLSQNSTKCGNIKTLANSKVNDPSKIDIDIRDKTSKTPCQGPIQNNTDSWLAAYQAKREAALKNMKEGKLQSVVGISAFCGKNDQVSNFSKTNQVTKLMDKFKCEEVKPIKKQVQSTIDKAPAKLDTKQVVGGNFKFDLKNNPPKPLMTMESTPKPLMSMNILSKPLISSWNNSIPKPNGSPVSKNEGILGHVPSGFIIGGIDQLGNGCPVPLPKNNMQGGAQTGPSAFDKKPPPPPDKAISEVIGDTKPFSLSSGIVGDAKPFSSIGSIKLSDNFFGNAGKTPKNSYLQNYKSANFGMDVGQTIGTGMRVNGSESGCGLEGWARVDNSMKGWASTAITNIGGSLEAGVNSIGMSDTMTRDGVHSMSMGGALAFRGGMGGGMAGRGGNLMGVSGGMTGRSSSMGREGNGNYTDSSFQGGMTAMRMNPTNADRIPSSDAASHMRGRMGDSMESGGVGGYLRGGMGDFGRQYGQYSEQDYNSAGFNRSFSIGTPKNNNSWMYSGKNNYGYGQDFGAQSDHLINRSKPTVTFGKAKSTQLFQWIKPS